MSNNHIETSLAVPTKASSLSDWLNYMQQIHVSAIDMGLSRVMPVAERLGLVQSAKDDAYVFTVAGTNGKGSTTAVISEICQQAGYKTALYQSPHLIDFNERVRIDGNAVGDQTLINAFAEVESARLACELTLSFFEMTTLAAMLVFAQADCDVWVLEVGLGGRLDVVNIIDADLAVITNVGIDHVDWLGDTREKIGHEKAGILRKGIPLIYGEEDMPNTVRDRAGTLNCDIYQVGKNYDYLSSYSCDNEFDDDALKNKNVWQFSSAGVTLQLPRPSLSLVNTANAIAAVVSSKLAIEPSHIQSALTRVKLAGRFDYRQLANRHWLFDVAHNDRGMHFLLNQFVPSWKNHLNQYPVAQLHLVFSMLADKDINTVVKLLVESDLPIEKWHIAEIDHPRAADNQLLQQVLKQNEISQVVTYASLGDATNGVVADTKSEDLILVCGSFHTISDVLITLN